MARKKKQYIYIGPVTRKSGEIIEESYHWEGTAVSEKQAYNSLRIDYAWSKGFRLLSPDPDVIFPGTLEVKINDFEKQSE